MAVAVAGEGNLVSEGVAGGGEAFFDADAGLGEAAEELFLGRGSGQGLADALAQGLAGCLGSSGALGFRAFGAGGPLGSGAVSVVEDLQAEFCFDLAAFGLGADAVLVAARAAPVLALEGGDEVDVVVGVAYGDPAACLVVALLGDAGGVHDPTGGLGPFLIGQVAVAGGRAYRAVPHVSGRAAVLRKGEDGQIEPVGELLEGGSRIASRIGGEARHPGSDQVRVSVFLPATGAVEVVQQSVRAAAGGDVGHHRQRLAISMAASSTRTAARRTRATASSTPSTWPPELRMRAIWLRLFPTRASCALAAMSSSTRPR